MLQSSDAISSLPSKQLCEFWALLWVRLWDLRAATELISWKKMIIKAAGIRGTLLSGQKLFLEGSDSCSHPDNSCHQLACSTGLFPLRLCVYLKCAEYFKNQRWFHFKYSAEEGFIYFVVKFVSLKFIKRKRFKIKGYDWVKVHSYPLSWRHWLE